jgi:hypothetical protein
MPSRLIVALVCIGLAPLAQAADLSFNRDIRPILSEYCLACHGPGKQVARLRLDQADAARKGGKSGAPAVVPGKPAMSELVKRLHTGTESERMPPASTRKAPSPREVKLLEYWIASGATYEGHWAFEPLAAVPVPAGEGAVIDRFLQATLRDKGMAMRPEAPREALIRRVSFTLTGLPPTVAEVDQFLADKAPGAYERMVDRYFASPRHGEEMARHWLDIARYADTHGLHLDNERQMWAYRDWVVNAFNRNMPFDQFTIDQLAGDLVPNPSLDQQVATGFSRCNVTTGEGGSISEEWVYRNAVERASTVFTTWLGLTGACAQCHDHKFDPISARDFYSMYAFFHSAADPPLDGNALLTAPTVRLETAEVKARRDKLNARLAETAASLVALARAADYSDPAKAMDKPAPVTRDEAWFDDAFPAGGRVFASPGHPTQYVDASSGKVFSGSKALRRTDSGLAQDVIEGMPAKSIPKGAKLFAHVYIDPANKPKTLMLQYFKGGWLHRAAWGDYDAIPWGKAGTTERVNAGPLPESGKWVRLEIEASKLGLVAGDQVTGFAMTQFGGLVYWDKAGVSGSADPAADPALSLEAWWRSQRGKNQTGVAEPLAGWIKAGPSARKVASEISQVRDHFIATAWDGASKEIKSLRAGREAILTELGSFDSNAPGTFVYRDLDKPRESFVMMRGQYDKPGEKVEPAAPAVLGTIGVKDRRANRLDLARWLVSPTQSLAPRVIANRFWQQVFGVGLVKSSGDFGTQGDLPSHPALLDWLARDFRDRGWNVRDLIRSMVLSRAFRQDSAAPPPEWAKDPENRLLGRGPRIRLDAEQVRDNALFVGGLAKLDMGGRGTMPYQPPNIWEPVGFTGSNTRIYQQSKGDSLYRRSLYVFLKRTAPAPFMSNFDAPNRETPCSRRERSNTPLQALQLMNDTQHVEAARGLAARLAREAPDSAARVRLAWRVVVSRLPEPDEEKSAVAFLERMLARYGADKEAAGKLVRVGESPVPAGIPEPDLAACTMLANLVLNLDEAINRN